MTLDLSLNLSTGQDAHDVIVIGGGPGGLSAALYAARAKLRTLVIDMNPRAGALGITEKIANYPGVPEVLTGSELLERFRIQAESFGAEIVQAQVLATELVGETKQVITAEGIYRARTVIIASGSMGRKPSIEGEAEFIGKGVSYCAACDAAFFQSKDVAVVGNGDVLIDELAVIAKFARTVYVIPRGKLSAEHLAVIDGHDNVELINGARIKRIVGDKGVTGIEMIQAGEERFQPVAGVFVYLTGNQPAIDYLDGSLAITEEGCIEVNHKDFSTNQEGVFAVGDVTCSQVLLQCVISGRIHRVSYDRPGLYSERS